MNRTTSSSDWLAMTAKSVPIVLAAAPASSGVPANGSAPRGPGSSEPEPQVLPIVPPLVASPELFAELAEYSQQLEMLVVGR